MYPTIQIESITYRRNEEEDSDGYVIYLLLSPCSERPCRHVCETHPEMEHRYERQLFRRGSVGHRKDATDEEKASNRANVWGWDGNEQAPTLQPSFLARRDDYTAHLFLTNGKIDLCSDSTVRLVESLDCRDKPFEGEDGG